MTERARFELRGMEQITHYISIQGSISAGKSTLAAAVRRYLARERLSATCPEHDDSAQDPAKDYFLVVDEPVALWLEEKYQARHPETGEPQLISILEAFYRDPAGMGFIFQVNAFNTRLTMLRDALNTICAGAGEGRRRRVHLITDRSMPSDHCFFKTVLQYIEAGRVRAALEEGVEAPPPGGGTDLQVQRDVYESFYATICDELVRREDMMIFLPTPPEVCAQRIPLRGRLAETERPIERSYLDLLGENHDAMVLAFESRAGTRLFRAPEFAGPLNEAEVDAVVAQLMTRIRDAVRAQ
jgi:deoxyadenosine/deoxycytidine kinase